MTTTPTGTPAWVGGNDASTYGGHANKRNYQLVDAVNPETDITAAQFIRMAADMAAVARVAPFCVGVVQCDDTTPAAPTVTSIRQMTSVSTAGYPGASPSHASFPVATRDGDGSITLTWPTSATDEYGVSADIVIRHVSSAMMGYAGTGKVEADIVAPNQVTLIARDSSLAVIPDALMRFEVR